MRTRTREILERRADKIFAASGLPTREQDRADQLQCAATLLARYAPIQKTGAGELRFKVQDGPEVCARTVHTYSAVRVARSYKYPVYDQTITVDLPADWVASMIAGVITLHSRGESDRQPDPIACAWVVRARGLALRVVNGFVWRGHHIEAPALEAAKQKIFKIRRAALVAHQRKIRAGAAAGVSGWITRDSLRRAGACPAGVQAAIAKLVGTAPCPEKVIALRASFVAARGYQTWAMRAAVPTWQPPARTQALASVNDVRQ